MKNPTRRLVAGISSLAAVGTLGACGFGNASSSNDTVSEDCEPVHSGIETVQESTLTVASFDLEPYTKLAGTDLQGLEGDVLKKIAAMECLSLVAQTSSAAAAIPAVQSNRADITAASWYRTSARAEVVALSAPVFADQMALISESGVSDLQQIKDEGMSIGTVDGYLWVDDLREMMGDQLKLYGNTPNLYGDLKAGRVDVIVDGFGVGTVNGEGYEIVAAEPNDAVSASQNPGQTNFPMNQDNAELIEAVDADIATLREDGTLAELLKKYDMDPAAADPGAPDEL